VLSERIHPENRLILPRVPYEPIVRAKGSSGIAVGVVGRAGHDDDVEHCEDPVSALFEVNSPLSGRARPEGRAPDFELLGGPPRRTALFSFSDQS
jgi:hypothetical protein